MVVPKSRKTLCISKKCKKHRLHKVTQYKKGKDSLYAQGKRRYDAKQAGFGGQTKPVFHKSALYPGNCAFNDFAEVVITQTDLFFCRLCNTQRPRLLKRLCFVLSAHHADLNNSASSSDANILSWVTKRRRREQLPIRSMRLLCGTLGVCHRNF